MRTTYKRFPPGFGNLLVPMSDRGSALASLRMLAPVRRRAVLAARAARWSVRIGGPRALPGRPVAWEPGPDPVTWLDLVERWKSLVGDWDAVGVYERPDTARPGSALLLIRRGDPVAFVKLRRTDREAMENEALALRTIHDHRPREFGVPALLGRGAVGAWSFLAMAPLPAGLHGAWPDPDLDRVIAEIQAGLEELPKPPATPPHWRPMHGDLAPWNLRVTEDGRLILVDWEYAGWGPPAADEIWFKVTRAVTGRGSGEHNEAIEAIRFWHDRISAWPKTEDRDGRLVAGMLAELERMRGDR